MVRNIHLTQKKSLFHKNIDLCFLRKGDSLCYFESVFYFSPFVNGISMSNTTIPTSPITTPIFPDGTFPTPQSVPCTFPVQKIPFQWFQVSSLQNYFFSFSFTSFLSCFCYDHSVLFHFLKFV